MVYKTTIIIVQHLRCGLTGVSVALQRAKVRYGIAPKTIWKSPIKFSTLNDDYMLRSQPIKDDTSDYMYNELSYGNGIANYAKNARGLAWAEYKDNTNRVWWFVEMYSLPNVKNNHIYGSDTLIHPRALGWMSSRFLQKQP